MSSDRLVSTAEAARLLGVTVSAMEQWRFRGTGPAYVRLQPRVIRYRVGELDRYVSANTEGRRSR